LAKEFARLLIGAIAGRRYPRCRRATALASTSQGTSSSSAWMMISTHSGEKSIPASGGITRRTGRSTGSARLLSKAWAGE
jgi:hypothetical protein